MTEEWRPLPAWEGVYGVSSHGRVRRLKAAKGATVGKILRAHLDKDGYRRVRLADGPRAETLRIGRLVAQSFVPNPERKPEVNHRDGIKANDLASNLEWSTRSENELHAFSTGLAHSQGIPHPNARREKHGQARLTEGQVVLIRQSGDREKSLAQQFGVATSTVGRVRRGETWKDVN